MFSFLNFLFEDNKKAMVFAYGRFNPPTTGHQVLVNKIHDIAKKHNASHEIVLSHSQDKNKNPLSPEKKLHYAKKMFPDTNLSVAQKSEPSIIHHAKKFNKAGHKHLIVVAGSDRIPEFHKLLHKYNGKEYHYDKIDVVSAGERDENSESVKGMSASKMRKHAANNDFENFKKGVPSHVKEKDAKSMFHDVQKGMGK